ncbi:unnamed protein product [Leptidea sinapis]|uniref:protein-tyrosine-phosphatase n=1 Tax=Leptidea sinapis TaxID=189913 RepID=A0A5E4PSL2_9NEOP|nr:unnamed protein product [Leptidea sinapis]
MPFKLKLKKTRQYNVASKSLFVISVELLDGGVADCTLSVDSTVEYLKNLLMFPKQMLDNGQIIDSSSLPETGRLEWLTAAVIQHHMSLHNMSQAQAEEGFITTCQQLRGYGQEMFTAKEQRDQTEVTIAISLTGIRVLTDTSDTPHFYRWTDITNVINHKRTFSVECQQQGQSASFVLPTPEDGKYVWRMCVMQHTFYMRHQPREDHRPNFQEHGLSESREELEVREVSSSRLEPLTADHRAHSTSCLELADHSWQPQPRPRALVPSYRPAPDYETAIQQKYQQQRAEAQLRYQNHSHSQLVNTQPLVYGSHPDIHRVHYPDVTRHTAPLSQTYVGNYPIGLNPNLPADARYVNVYKPPPPYPSNGLASNSTPDLAVASQLNYHRGYINAHVSGSSPDLVSTRTALNRPYLGYVNPVVNYNRPVLPPTHGTYNNLPSVLEPKHIIIDHVSDSIQKVYDERGNIMYSVPMPRISYQRHLMLPQAIKHNDTQEPIYENVPLPWQSEQKIRERAQSLTTSDEINRLNERNGSQPPIDTQNISPNVPYVKVDNDSHYVNAQIIKGVRESSIPKENISLNIDLEKIVASFDRVSIKNDDKDCDETPYQSLSTHRVSNNNMISKSVDNVTSISVPDIRVQDIDSSQSTDSALSSSNMNSTYSTSELESSKGSNKEKKRRRWGMFMGRGSKGEVKGAKEVKSATLGRDRAKVGQTANKHRWSTGLPKFQPLPPSITKETLCQLLERKMSDEQLSFAFDQIPKGRENSTEVEYRTALLPQYGHLNHGDCLPYEDNRVKLTPTPENPHGYINASHITKQHLDKVSHNTKRGGWSTGGGHSSHDQHAAPAACRSRSEPVSVPLPAPNTAEISEAVPAHMTSPALPTTPLHVDTPTL